MSSDAGPSRGLLIVVSAPSGTGKTTVVERLVEVCPQLVQSRSYTSRPPRVGERDGVDYNFVDRPAFEALIERDGFLEWADVFGNLYGTGRAETESLLAAGLDVVLVIDVQGSDHIEQFPFVRAAAAALGCPGDRIELVMNQFVTLNRGGEQVKQSTRRATYVTVEELLEEVGVDVFRFFMVQRKA